VPFISKQESNQMGKKSQLDTEDVVAATDKSYMYYIKSQPWLPHYVTKGVFVAPGGVEKKEIEVQIMGGIKQEVYLWPRYWMTEKSRMVR
jgi:hypothetical protein